VQRLPELGAVPYFPSFKVPLPKTNPTPRNAQADTLPNLSRSNPDNLQAPEDQTREQDEIRPVENIEQPIDPQDPSKSDNSTMSNRKSAEIRIQSEKGPENSQISSLERATKKRTSEHSAGVKDCKKSKVDVNPKPRVNSRTPNPNCPRATTRSRVERENRVLTNDRELALELQDQELRRSTRNCAIKFPPRNPFSS
jgi:hypothetical protein